MPLQFSDPPFSFYHHGLFPSINDADNEEQVCISAALESVGINSVLYENSIAMKKRPSLQHLLLPFQNSDFDPDSPRSSKSVPTSAVRSWTWSVAGPSKHGVDDVAADLLDDDPFADLTASPASSLPPPIPPSSPKSPPKSPLSPTRRRFTTSEVQYNPISLVASPSTVPVTVSPLTRPAFTKPAFPTRPSLPSLHTLASMNVYVPNKVRSGKVGATLPVEPWDLAGTPGSRDSTVTIRALRLEKTDTPQTTQEISSLSSYGDTSDEDYDEGFGEENDVPSSFSHPDVELPDSDTISATSSPINSLSRSLSAASLTSSRSCNSFDGETTSSYLFHSSSSDEDSIVTFPSSPEEYDTLENFLILSADIENDSFLGSTPTPPSSMYITAMPQQIEKTQIQPLAARHTWNDFEGEPADASGWGNSRGSPREQRGGGSGYTHSYAGGGSDGYGNGNGNGNGYSGSGSNSSGHGDRRGNDDSDRPKRMPGSSFSPPSSDSEEEEDDSGESSDGYGESSPTRNVSTSDDDVPLAQSIPTALKAQRTIRLKAKAERDARRKARAERSRNDTLRPAGAAAGNVPSISSTQEAAIHASRSIKSSQTPPTRQRAQTLSSRSPPIPVPFSTDDLSKKLQNLQARTSSEQPRGRSSGGRRGDMISKSAATSPTSPADGLTRSLRPMRSFHYQERREPNDLSFPLHTDAEPRLGRSTTRGAATARRDPHTTIPPVPVQREQGGNKLVKEPRSSSSRPSIEMARPSIPPPPLPKTTLVQQRVFVGDMQCYNMVAVGSNTTAGDVISMVNEQGTLKAWKGVGGWMLHEVAQDFGMERPIRDYELLSDVEASWNKDKMVNSFVIKLTTYADVLSASKMPVVSPRCGGYVEWEIKRGKWVKRYLSLREHSLWLSKRDTGKDEEMLCSLSNYDAYKVTRVSKAPKKFTFAVKSTDKLSFFENTSDYLHVFSCSEKDGYNWMEKILLARSYVLHQERNVLFNPKSSGGLSRAPTRKVPAQPLLNVGGQRMFEPASLLGKS